MSDVVHVSLGEGGVLEVVVGAARITISELRIRPMSNFKTPYQVLGKGQSSIALNTEQMVSLVSEYLRFGISSAEIGPVKVESKSVGWHFLCEYSA